MAKKRKNTAAAGRARRTSSCNNKAAMETAVLPPLPDELAEDILLRLPSKQLAASRCVSPPWNDLLSSAAFADRHHAAAAADAAAAPRFVTLAEKAAPRVIAGAGKACRGAVLAGNPWHGVFYLCNPSTGGALPLPPHRYLPWSSSAGLGYDARTGEHKVVLLENLRTWRPPVDDLRCDVLAIGGGGARCWRAPVGGKNCKPGGGGVGEGEVVSTKNDPVFADGHLHWMLAAWTGMGSQRAHGEPKGVFSFELGGESFRRLPLPLSAAVDGGKPALATLGELGGHLCFVRDLRCRQLAVAAFEVWMLRDFELETWSLDRRVDLTPHVGKELTTPWKGDFFVVSYAGDGNNKVLLASTTHQAYVHESDTRALRSVARRRALYFVLYEESLVHVAGMEYGKFQFTRYPKRVYGSNPKNV